MSSNAGAGSHGHPPYKQMILSAITALKEKGGSSKTAIAKQIAETYTDLPPTHDALLGTHLQRLKNQGDLIMVKHSYMLSPSNSAPSATDKRKPGRPPKNPTPGVAKRGRPPKNPAPTTVAKRGRPPKNPAPTTVAKRGRPPKNPAPGVGSTVVRRGRPSKNPAPGVGSKVVKRGRPAKNPTAAADSTVAKRRGRPPKIAGSGPATEKRKPGRPIRNGGTGVGPAAAKRTRGRPAKVSPAAGKKTPGRPKKLTVGPALSGAKKRPGRPKKTPVAGAPTGSSEKRKRGRPSKKATAMVISDQNENALVVGNQVANPDTGVDTGFGEIVNGTEDPSLTAIDTLAAVVTGTDPVENVGTVAGASSQVKKRGRPKKNVAPPTVTVTADEGASPSAGAAAGAKKRGRPKKIATPSVTATETADVAEAKEVTGNVGEAKKETADLGEEKEAGPSASPK